MNRDKHTELPFEVFKGGLVMSADAGNGCVCTCADYVSAAEKGEKEANAAFIVKACNSHYQLLEALKELTEAASHVAAESLFEPVDKARKAIEEAEK